MPDNEESDGPSDTPERLRLALLAPLDPADMRLLALEHRDSIPLVVRELAPVEMPQQNLDDVAHPAELPAVAANLVEDRLLRSGPRRQAEIDAQPIEIGALEPISIDILKKPCRRQLNNKFFELHAHL
ncbi:MAG: hypothetical protein AB7F78_11650 [Hyphomicrobiaceae bacterium]